MPIVILLLVACLASPLAAQQRVAARRAANADAAIRIVNLAGSLRVTGWNKDSVAVSGQVGEPGRFYIGGATSGLKLGVEAPEGNARLPVADLDVRVPQGARLWVKSAAGEIEVNEVTGSLTVISASGRIRVAGSPSDLTVESLDGNVEVVATGPSARVRSGSGTVVIRGVIRELTASTVSGPLLVGMEGAVARARLETISGEIAFKGDLVPDGVLDADTHSGNVELRLPPGLGVEYDVNTYGGTVRNEITRDRPNAKGALHFSVGDGRASVVVRTFKGTVELEQRGPEGRVQ